MRPKRQTLSALGSTDWIRVSHLTGAFAVGIGVNLSNGAVLTYSVQHTFDSPTLFIDMSIARVTTVATATFDDNHGKAIGDSIVVENSGDANLDGTFAIASVPTTTTLTYTVADAGAASASAKAALFSVFNNDGLADQTASDDGNYAFPPSMIRLAITAYTGGSATVNFIFGAR